jgi:hypothetical protein
MLKVVLTFKCVYIKREREREGLTQGRSYLVPWGRDPQGLRSPKIKSFEKERKIKFYP